MSFNEPFIKRGRGRPSKASQMEKIKIVYDTAPSETDEQIEARLNERFEIINILTEACAVGNARSLILSGPAGVGKSYGVETMLHRLDPNEINFNITKGFARATGLFKLLYQYRLPGQVIVMDDADAIFGDDIALGLLKAVCDTSERRRVSWLAETNMVDEESATPIPRHFDFNGSMIFISNLDFDALIEKGHKFAPHLEALVSRSHYIDCGMKTRRDYLIRIRSVIKQGLLNKLNNDQKNDVVKFIEDNHLNLRELSLRMAVKIGDLRKSSRDWSRIAKITCCKNR